MTQTYAYDGSDVATVRRNSVRLQTKAYMGAIGEGELLIDDATGAIEIVGQKPWVIEQSACSTRPTMFRGYTGPRDYAGGDEDFLLPNQRRIKVTLLDLNARAGFKKLRAVHNADRDKETIDDRMAWLLGLGVVSALFTDRGFVASSSLELDDTDYTGRTATDVLNDMATRLGWNWFLYWDEAGTPGCGLFFADANTSTWFTSTLTIADVGADSSTSFAPVGKASLKRDPSRVVSAAWGRFEHGNVCRTRAATEAIFEPRDGEVTLSSIKRRNKARALGDEYLFIHRNEEDFITCTIRVPKEKCNLVVAGQRIEGTFTRFATEGYGEATWFRITEMTATQPMDDDETYDLELTLSPQEGGCSVLPTFVDTTYEDSVGATGATETFPFGFTTTPGDVVVVAVFNNYAGGAGDLIAPPAGWNWVVVNEDTADGGTSTRCNVFWKKAAGESSITLGWEHTISANDIRFNVIEYAGLTNPVLSGSVTLNQQDPSPGSAISASTSYPDGPCAVVFVGFMEDGPQSGDDLGVNSGVLRTPINAALHGSHEVAFADKLLDTTAGSTTLQFTFTGSGPTLTAGLVFAGDNCA